MLARLDVALYIDVYLWPERPQRHFRGEEVVHELLVVPSDVIARLLDAHVLRPHEHGDEVVTFQPAVEFHVIGIQVLEVSKREKGQRDQLLAPRLGIRAQGTLTFAQQTMSTALKYIC
jgi:hypothetical protein